MNIEHGKYTVLGCREINENRMKSSEKKAAKHVNIDVVNCMGKKRGKMTNIMRMRAKHMNLEDFRCMFGIFMYQYLNNNHKTCIIRI